MRVSDKNSPDFGSIEWETISIRCARICARTNNLSLPFVFNFLTKMAPTINEDGIRAVGQVIARSSNFSTNCSIKEQLPRGKPVERKNSGQNNKNKRLHYSL
jgi:hypothetical protein